MKIGYIRVSTQEQNRLLRHDCTVHLFSRFPMKQAKVVKGFDYGKE